VNRVLFPHQQDALQKLREALLCGSRRIMMQAPTGFGKTILGCAIVSGALAKGKRVLFCVPAIELIDQTVKRFAEEGIYDVGVIQATHEMTDWNQPIQVASIATLMRRNIPKADIVIIDEAHRWFKFYGKTDEGGIRTGWFVHEDWVNIPFIGLSATPWTKGLGNWYDSLIIASTVRELIDAGFLSDFRVFAPSHPDLSNVRTKRVEDGVDYREGDLSKVMNTKVLVADVVQTWKAHAKGRPTLCFAVDRAHARSLQEYFEAEGVKAGYVDAYTPKEERRELAQQFANGDVEVICNVGVLTTGVDWDVRCIILARPTKSEILFVQMIGRGLRTAPGKDACLILDHSDSHLRLGFVTDIHHEELNDGTKGSVQDIPPPLPKECPKCHFLKSPGTVICPNCGHKPEGQKASGTVHVDGELVEFEARDKPKAGKNIEPTINEKMKWYQQFLWFEKEKKYKEGWASRQYRNKFGAWPENRLVENLKTPLTPSPEVCNYVKSRQIAWAAVQKKLKRYG